MQLQCISCRLAISGEQKRSGTQQIMQRNVFIQRTSVYIKSETAFSGKGNSISMGSAAKLGRTCNVINAGGTPSALSCISVRPSVRLRVASNVLSLSFATQGCCVVITIVPSFACIPPFISILKSAGKIPILRRKSVSFLLLRIERY